MAKGTIYLEPRKVYDNALIDSKNIVYCYDLLIEILMDFLQIDFFEARDYYSYNIEPLIFMGLCIQEDDDECS
tara:strand:+ start:1828 stop:2046 length:219 start_codon:yes stop_codon:yes gene_type:complete